MLTAGFTGNAEELDEIEELAADAVRLACVIGDLGTAETLTEHAEALAVSSGIPHRQGNTLYCRGLLGHDPARLLEAAQRYGDGTRPLLAAKAMEAAERLGLDPASEVVNVARDAARAVDEAMDRAGVTFCDPGAESPEADRLCRFTVESPGAELMSQAVGARRRMLLAATAEILARKWSLTGDELLFVRGIQIALETDLEWSGQGVRKIDQHRLGTILRAAKRRSTSSIQNCATNTYNDFP